MASFRSGGKILYGIIAAGYNFKNKEEVYAFELGLGAHIVNTNVFRVNAEVSTLTLESFWSGEYFKRIVNDVRESAEGWQTSEILTMSVKI